MTTACIGLALILALQTVTLPDSPQARAVMEYINAFNSGTEADTLKVLEQYASPERLKQRTPEQRAEAYRSSKERFGTLKIARVISSSPAEIVLAIKRLDGTEAWWTFAFEPGEVIRFAGVSVKNAQP